MVRSGAESWVTEYEIHMWIYQHTLDVIRYIWVDLRLYITGVVADRCST